MPIETFLLILFAAIVCMVCYLAAGTIYDFHYRLKAKGSRLSKVVTGDRKKLDDRGLWVRRYRLKTLILLALVVAVAIFIFFDI